MKIEIENATINTQVIEWKDKKTGEPKSFTKYTQKGFLFDEESKYPDKLEISLDFDDNTKQAKFYEPGTYTVDEKSFYVDRNKNLSLATNLILKKVK